MAAGRDVETEIPKTFDPVVAEPVLVCSDIKTLQIGRVVKLLSCLSPEFGLNVFSSLMRVIPSYSYSFAAVQSVLVNDSLFFFTFKL